MRFNFKYCKGRGRDSIRSVMCITGRREIVSSLPRAKVAAINLEMKEAKDVTTEKGANRAAFKTLRTEQHTAIKAALTPEQLTTYESMKGGRKGK